MTIRNTFNALALSAVMMGAPASDAYTPKSTEQRARMSEMIRHYGDVSRGIAAYVAGHGHTSMALAQAAVNGGFWVEYLPESAQEAVRAGISTMHRIEKKRTQGTSTVADDNRKRFARNDYMLALIEYYRGNASHAIAAYSVGTARTDKAVEQAKLDHRPNSWVSYLPQQTQEAVRTGMATLRSMPSRRNTNFNTRAATAKDADERKKAEKDAMTALEKYYNGDKTKATAALHCGIMYNDRAIARAEKDNRAADWLFYTPRETHDYVRANLHDTQQMAEMWMKGLGL